MTEQELAYIAGIVDGEGSIKIAAAKRLRHIRYQCRVDVINTDLRLIEWIYKQTNLGKIHIHSKKKNSNKRAFRWILLGQECEKFLETIYPFLVIKKEQADVVFRFRKTYIVRYNKKIQPPDSILKERNDCFCLLKQLHHKEF